MRSVVGDRLRICGIEPGGLIEPQVGLGRGAGGTQGRRPTGKIEVGEDGANGKGIGDEGDDAHGSAARWQTVAVKVTEHAVANGLP